MPITTTHSFRTRIATLATAIALSFIPACTTSTTRNTMASPGNAHPSATTGGWSIVIHGGAGMLDKAMPDDQKAAYRAGLTDALNAGKAILAKGGTSLAAAEAAVLTLEDNELFNAGKGAVLTRAGTCELDASIMDGRTLKAGAAAGLTTVKNPIRFARLIMELTPHILFAGEGAEKLAAEFGAERVDPAYFITPRRQQQLEQKLKQFAPAASGSSHSSAFTPHPSLSSGTVGCVALDTHGNIAAATSTGGMTAKMPGRIGDSPIIGAGCYANNATLGVSCTGTGEQFIRHVVAYDLAALVKYKGLSLREAARVVLTERLDPDDGGLIAIGRDGTIVMMTTTGCMPRAAADSSGKLEIGIWDPEKQ